jgi:hypothetical protein
MGILPNKDFISFASFSGGKNLYGYGFSSIIYPKEIKKTYVPVIFIRKNINHFQLKIGRWQQQLTTESSLSSGSLIRGNNSIPIPQVTLSIPKYKEYKIYNNSLWFKGGFTHGWLSKNSYLKAPYLHEKYIYIQKRFNNNSELSLGLVHEAIWGGETIDYGLQPDSFTDYLYVVLARPASSSGSISEQLNRLGNHLGIWDISYKKALPNKIFKFYYQHLFEDGSGAYQYFFDEIKALRFPSKSFNGLFGVELVNKNSKLIELFLYEYLNTMIQSGSNAPSDSTYGWDNYYNHHIYLSGWVNNGKVIGNPLFTLGSNNGHYSNLSYIINNRIVAHHIGFAGFLFKNIHYKILITYSSNYGTYYDKKRFNNENKFYRFDEGLKQFSTIIEFSKKNIWNNIDMQLSYAMDNGELLKNSTGFVFVVNYNFSNLSYSQ